MLKLQDSKVAVFGIGGVGGYVTEALARSGVGALELIDRDTVSLSNINRQIIALHSTVGRYKTEVAAKRVRDINPDCKVSARNCFFLPENKDEFDFSEYDYVVDAIDTVTGKLAIIECAKNAGVPVISSMGAGNKIHPEMFEVADIYETSVCPLAKVMRHECRKRGITSLKVVYSREEPIQPDIKPEGTEAVADSPEKTNNPEDAGQERRKAVPGSVAFTPSVAGLIIAGEVIKDLIYE